MLVSVAQAASPFGVTADRAVHDGHPAVRVAFEIPADHHLYSSFSVAAPGGGALEPLSVPDPDTFKPDDFEASYSTSFAAYYAPPAGDSIVVAYQGCKGELCYLPEEATLDLGQAPPPRWLPSNRSRRSPRLTGRSNSPPAAIPAGWPAMPMPRPFSLF
jgi:hypothetical protein